MPYGSTALRLVAERCPRALRFRDEGQPAPRDVYAVGSACHAVLDALQAARGDAEDELAEDAANAIADQVRAALVAGGRMWRGERELPMRPDDVAQGVQLALQWHRRHGTIQGARSELGLGLSVKNGKLVPVAYDDTPADGYRTALDLVYIELGESEDGVDGSVTVVARDYKTAWSAGPKTLETEQMRTQAILAVEWALGRGVQPTNVRIEVGAARTGQVYSATVPADGFEIEAWRADLAATIAGLEEQRATWGTRPAVPSYRCGGCEYLYQCGDGQAWMRVRAESPEEMAERFVAVTHERARLQSALRVALAEADPIRVGDATVGHQVVHTQTPRKDIQGAIVDRWALGSDGWSSGLAAGLIKAAKLGTAQVKAIAQALVPGRTKAANLERHELVEQWTETATSVRFDVHRAGEDEET